jgi:hypothetical protein
MNINTRFSELLERQSDQELIGLCRFCATYIGFPTFKEIDTWDRRLRLTRLSNLPAFQKHTIILGIDGR